MAIKKVQSTSNPFPPVKVLITRPARQSLNLCHKLDQLGIEWIVFPALEIVSLNPDEVEKLSNINVCWDKVIFTSANAVYPLMSIWHLFKNKSLVYAIGSGTAAALQNQGIEPILPAQKQFHSEGLLALETLKNIAGEKIAIYTGKEGRMILPEVLRQRGATVGVFELYERRCPDQDISLYWKEWHKFGINLIACTSQESLRNLCSLAKTSAAKKWLFQQQLLVISIEMKALVERLGFQKPAFLANNASDDALIDALKSSGH